LPLGSLGNITFTIGIPQGDPDANGTVSRNVKRLVEGGLPEAEFWTTFVQCFRCKWIMIQSQFPGLHRCHRRSRLVAGEEFGVADTQEIEFIDLTSDEPETITVSDSGRFVDLTMD
jgi:hypothetical protein